MEDVMPAQSRLCQPLHLCVVGIASLMWNAFGCYDYAMTKLYPAQYLGAQGLSAEAQAWLTGMPPVATGAWALGVWASLAGAILLNLRSRRAVGAFALSFVGLAASQLWQVTHARPAEMDGPAMWGITAAIWVLLAAQLLYARAQVRAGNLG